LPQLEQTLVTLADLQLRYEIECDYLEVWSGSAAIKDCLLAELTSAIGPIASDWGYAWPGCAETPEVRNRPPQSEPITDERQ